ncbi:MAG: hypothetical protein GWO24_23005 [Akkermansiaceae bacterium]|nr:hypothetical protein [Akkermansiaceae bacterium]
MSPKTDITMNRVEVTFDGLVGLKTITRKIDAMADLFGSVSAEVVGWWTTEDDDTLFAGDGCEIATTPGGGLLIGRKWITVIADGEPVKVRASRQNDECYHPRVRLTYRK